MAQRRRYEQRSPRDRTEPGTSAARPAEQSDVTRIDDLLDEIDSVLEENAEEFVKNYVQKGGE